MLNFRMKPVHIAIAAAGLAAGAYFVLGGRSSADALEYVSWSKALEIARSEKKPILLNFGGPW